MSGKERAGEGQRGFALTEILIVLGIFGILVGIVAVSLGGLADTPTKRSTSFEHGTVQAAIDTYQTQAVVVEWADDLTMFLCKSGSMLNPFHKRS